VTTLATLFRAFPVLPSLIRDKVSARLGPTLKLSSSGSIPEPPAWFPPDVPRNGILAPLSLNLTYLNNKYPFISFRSPVNLKHMHNVWFYRNSLQTLRVIPASALPPDVALRGTKPRLSVYHIRPYLWPIPLRSGTSDRPIADPSLPTFSIAGTNVIGVR